jgi:hypothetical protein
VGFTSQISSINVVTGRHRPLVTGLISGGDGPVATTGVDGVSTQGGRILGIITASPQGVPPVEACAGNAGCLAALTKARSQVGKLIQVSRGGAVRNVADVGRFNYDYIVANKARLDPDNPDFQPGDSNPYGVLGVPSGAFVVDGGSNTLGFVKNSGRVSVLAYLPNPTGPPDLRFPYDAVPTCVTATSRGLYVGDLAGRLWLWSGGQLSQVPVPAGLLHSTNGCAADASGNVYVVDMFTGFDPDFGFAPNTGSVVKVTPSGAASVVASGLNLPSGIAVSRTGQIYVSNNGICPADTTGVPAGLCPSSGEVVRIG